MLKKSAVFLLGAVVSSGLHNLVSALIGGEEPVFFGLTLILALLFIVFLVGGIGEKVVGGGRKIRGKK